MILGWRYVTVSFHRRSGLVSQAKEGEHPGACAVPGEVAADAGVVAVVGAVEDADDDVADGGEQEGGLSGADPGGVFAECCVTDGLRGSRGRPAAWSSRLRSS